MVVRLCIVGQLLLGCAFALGFVWFRQTMPIAKQKPFVEQAQAIVVFTGSQARIPSAIALLREGYAPRLLVSGVHHSILSRDLTGEGGAVSDNIALGRAARNTFENAVETVLWSAHNNFTTIILVTSDLHMRRSKLYLRCLAPKLKVLPFAVAFSQSQAVRLRGDLKEYAKYLLALAHCTFATLPEAFPTPQASKNSYSYSYKNNDKWRLEK